MGVRVLPFEQNIEGCFEDKIGAGGLSRAAYEKALAQTEEALDWLREMHATGSLPLLDVPAREDDFPAFEEMSRTLLENTTDLFVLGTGGSSLGAQALAQLSGWGTQAHLQKGARIHFLDNLDASTMTAVLTNCDLRSTRFLVVSKSGSTIETIMQLLAAMSAIETAGGSKYMKHHFAVLTEPEKNGKPNPLRAFALEHGFPIIDHDTGVGGRFSVLTNVGLLPARLVGLDGRAVRAGAAKILAPILAGRKACDVPSAVGAAVSLALQSEQGADIGIFMAYADRLERLLAWHVQLWAESLGKQGRGTTPVKALGPVDQHSQLQLYLAGPKDKLYNLFLTEPAGKGPEILPSIATGEFEFLAGYRVGDLVDAEQRATADTLMRNGRPVRLFNIEKLDEETFGALFMHFMLETIIAGRMLGIDPFDQPAVEEGKILAKKYLSHMRH